MIKLLLFLVLVTLNLSLFANKIGIIGDIHCNGNAIKNAVNQMKKNHVTDIILTGDLINYEDSCHISSVISKTFQVLQKVVPSDHIYAIPGNWEDPLSRGGGYGKKIEAIHRMKTVFGDRLLTDRCNDPQTITIDGKKIRVTHEPPFDITDSSLIDLEHSPFTRFNPRFQPYLPRVNILPEKEIDLDIFGDTHIRTIFFTKQGVPVLNPGALVSGFKKTGGTSYAIYDTSTSDISFHNPSAHEQLISFPEIIKTGPENIILAGGQLNITTKEHFKNFDELTYKEYLISDESPIR